MSDDSRDQQWYRSRSSVPSYPEGVYPRSAAGAGPYADGRRDPLPGEDRYRQTYRRRVPRGRSLASTLGHTVLGAFLPGLGLMVAGRLRAGATTLFGFLALIGVGLWLVLFRSRNLIGAVLDADTLAALGAFLFAIGLVWVGIIVATHRSLRSRMATPLDRILGALVVSVLALVVLSPLAIGSRYAFVSRGVVLDVFDAEDSKSATRPDNVTEADPWGGRDRVNLMLLGGDGDVGRAGVRTDTVMVASIDTDTGNTVLFSLPRNLQQIPFPEDSPLYDAYPDGEFDDGPGESLEYMLNAMYRNVPAQHPGILGETDHPGADVLKLAVGEVLGLQLDYYLLINLDGFKQLVNALGGITVNINTEVAIGGSTDAGIPPHDWLQPGPNQHLDGYHALWFARGRYGSDDYQRMERQRCTMQAIIDKARPAQVLRRYEQLAETSKEIVETDIPGQLLPALVDLSLKVKGADVTSVVFNNKLISPADPDYDFIRAKVAKSLSVSSKKKDPGGAKDADPNGSKDQNPGVADEDRDPGDGTGDRGEDGTGDSAGTEAEAPDPIEDSCAYDPE